MYAEPDPYGGGVRGNIPRSGGERPRAGASTRILSGEPAERVMLDQKRDHASDDLTPATIRGGILGFGQRAVQSLNPSAALGNYVGNTIAGVVAEVLDGGNGLDTLRGSGIDALNRINQG